MKNEIGVRNNMSYQFGNLMDSILQLNLLANEQAFMISNK